MLRLWAIYIIHYTVQYFKLAIKQKLYWINFLDFKLQYWLDNAYIARNKEEKE